MFLPLSLALLLVGAPAPTAAETKAAVDGLLAAHSFQGAAIGIAGRLSDGVRDFRVIARDKDAAAHFAKVASEGTPAGRLYGLVGLYVTDLPTFERLRATTVPADASIQTTFGCIMGQEKAASILTRIGHGSYASEFLGAEAGTPWVEKWTAPKPGAQGLVVERNASADRFVGKSDFDTRFTVAVAYAKAGAKGLPDPTELPSLTHIEDMVTRRLQSRRTVIAALKVTGDKARRFVFYTHDTAWTEQVVAEIRAEVPARTLTTASESDPGWSSYKASK